MCTGNTLIPNPNFGRKDRYSFMKDTVSRYIKVPCGHCPECLKAKQLSLVQRVSMECLNQYSFFCTLTYNDQSLRKIICSDLQEIRYADFSDVTNMIKRLRKDNAFGRPFRYLVVSELGSKRARPHFHLIWFVPKYDNDSVYTPINLEKKLFDTVLSYWQRNYGSRRNPDYRPLCTYVSKVVCGKIKSTYELHYIVPNPINGTSNDVNYYVTKYMMKPSDRASRLQQALKLNLSEEEYSEVWRVVKPRWVASLNFGFGVYGLQPRSISYTKRLDLLSSLPSFKYIRDCISRSRSLDYPSFFSPETGKPTMLSRYWKSFGNLFTVDDAVHFFYNDPRQRSDNVIFDERPYDDKIRVNLKHEKDIKSIESHMFNSNILFE